ncbi:MAG TPA: tetratricopeptide repeat protein [Phycisphaerae bacterium]|nr:tetratricopeptide repeat protein [Phycisphaerae bacterium]
MTRRSVAIALLAPLVVAGCNALDHSTQVEQSKKHWSHVRARVKLQLAQRSFQNAALDDALKACAEVVGLAPDMPEAHQLMSRIHLERGEVAKAQASLTLAESLAPDDPETSYLHGLIAERRGKLDEAIEFYHEAYQARSDELDYLVTYVECLIAADRCAEAMAVIQPRRADFERHASVHALAGQALSLLGRKIEAAGCYQLAVHLAPEDPVLREEAGLALLAVDRIEQAHALFDTGPTESNSAISPSLAALLADGLLRKSRRPDQAARLLEHAVTTHQNDPTLWLLLAEACMQTDRIDRAGEAIDQAARLAPDRAELWLLKAYHALATGRTIDAVRAARRLVQRDPDDVEARALLAKTLEIDPQTVPEAATHYQHILSIAPDNAWAARRLDQLNQRLQTARAAATDQ